MDSTQPLEQDNSVPSSTLPQIPASNLTSAMAARRNKKIMIIAAGAAVFLIVLLGTLVVLGNNRANESVQNNNTIDNDIVEEEEDENEEVPDEEDDEIVDVVENPDLTQVCSDEYKGIKFGMAEGWSCVTSEGILGNQYNSTSFAIRAVSNDASNHEFVLSNLGRGGASCNGHAGPPIANQECTETEFYENPNMKLTYYNTTGSGEIFGFVNLKNYENEYISITGPKIGKGQTISEEDKLLFIAMFESIHTFPVTQASSANYNVASYEKNLMNLYSYKELNNGSWKIQVPDTTKWTSFDEPNMHGTIAGQLEDAGNVAFYMTFYNPTFFETGVPKDMDTFIQYHLDSLKQPQSLYTDEQVAKYTKIEKFEIQNYSVAFISPVAQNSEMGIGEPDSLASYMLIFDYSGKNTPRIVTMSNTKTYDDSKNIAEMQHELLKYMGEKLTLKFP